LMVMPRRFGGLCLPLNESMALGLPVLMPDCSPTSLFLPEPMLVPARRLKRVRTRAKIWANDVDPASLARRIDNLYENPTEIESMSKWAMDWGEQNSWEAMRSTYEDAFESL